MKSLSQLMMMFVPRRGNASEAVPLQAGRRCYGFWVLMLATW